MVIKETLYISSKDVNNIREYVILKKNNFIDKLFPLFRSL